MNDDPKRQQDQKRPIGDPPSETPAKRRDGPDSPEDPDRGRRDRRRDDIERDVAR